MKEEAAFRRKKMKCKCLVCLMKGKAGRQGGDELVWKMNRLGFLSGFMLCFSFVICHRECRSFGNNEGIAGIFSWIVKFPS